MCVCVCVCVCVRVYVMCTWYTLDSRARGSEQCAQEMCVLIAHVQVDSLYLRANAFITLFCMVSTLFRADMSPERRLEGEGEATVTDSPPREAPGESCVCVCVCVCIGRIQWLT